MAREKYCDSSFGLPSPFPILLLLVQHEMKFGEILASLLGGERGRRKEKGISAIPRRKSDLFRSSSPPWLLGSLIHFIVCGTATYFSQSRTCGEKRLLVEPKV